MTAQGWLKHLERAKGHTVSAVGLVEMRQGVVLCKRVALISPRDIAREEGTFRS